MKAVKVLTANLILDRGHRYGQITITSHACGNLISHENRAKEKRNKEKRNREKKGKTKQEETQKE